jgi:alkylation response protein AidB-like acyl-CoA dehydrogenase
MYLAPTDEQRLFHETTRRFLEQSCPLAVVRELAEVNPIGFDRQWWMRGAELGWTSALVPDDRGGGSVSGQGLVDLALVAEEFGRLVSPGPLLPTNIVAAALGNADDPHHDHVLQGLLDGSVVAAWAIEERTSALDLDRIATTCRERSSGFVIDGTKMPVEAAFEADYFLVVARTDDDRVAQVLVEGANPGIAVRSCRSTDLVRHFGQVQFDGVEVSPEAIIGIPEPAGDAVVRQLQFANVLQCAEIAGAIDRVLELTLTYAADRHSFGRVLGSYQALKHRFADMKMWLEASHAATDAAARAVQEEAENAEELVSAAKVYIGERATDLLQDCIQLHGGVGLTWEHNLHLYLRRVMQDRALLGTPSDHRERIARLMDRPTAAERVYA